MPPAETAGAQDADLLASFESGTLEPALFRHAVHVRVAWLYLRRDPLARALERFAADLRRFAARAGKPDLYHETTTWAYFALIRERMEDSGADHSWERFAAANPDLLTHRPSVLERYYTKRTLGSERARRTFVLPDRISPAPSHGA
jgi:hypothetical protein